MKRKGLLLASLCAAGIMCTSSANAGNLIFKCSDASADFFLFNKQSQRLCLGKRKADAVIVGDAGTIVRTEPELLTLHHGTATFQTKSKALLVKTSNALIKLSPNSQAKIMESDSGLNIWVEACPKNESVRVRLLNEQKTLCELKAGQGISSASDEFQEVDLAPRSIFERHLSEGADKLSDSKEVPNSSSRASSASTPMRISAAKDSVFCVGNFANLSLIQGELFISSPSQTKLNVEKTQVEIPSLSSVLVSKNSAGLRIYDCHGTKNIKVQSSECVVLMNAGEEVSLLGTKVFRSQVAPHDGVGRRSFNLHTMASGNHIITDEFSIISLLKNHPVLKHLRRTYLDCDLKDRDRILITAAAIEIVKNGSEPYYQISNSWRIR